MQITSLIATEVPARVYCVIEDPFPVARISVTARDLGVKVEFIGTGRNLLAELAGIPKESWPSLIVVDLNNVIAKPLTLIPRLRTKLRKAIYIIGLVSRNQGDLKARGAKVGCDSVVPRTAFSQNLTVLLRRHGSVV